MAFVGRPGRVRRDHFVAVGGAVVGELVDIALDEVVLFDIIGRADPAHVGRQVDSMRANPYRHRHCRQS